MVILCSEKMKPRKLIINFLKPTLNEVVTSAAVMKTFLLYILMLIHKYENIFVVYIDAYSQVMIQTVVLDDTSVLMN